MQQKQAESLALKYLHKNEPMFEVTWKGGPMREYFLIDQLKKRHPVLLLEFMEWYLIGVEQKHMT